jgi:hypothetical protein
MINKLIKGAKYMVPLIFILLLPFKNFHRNRIY